MNNIESKQLKFIINKLTEHSVNDVLPEVSYTDDGKSELIRVTLSWSKEKAKVVINREKMKIPRDRETQKRRDRKVYASINKSLKVEEKKWLK